MQDVFAASVSGFGLSAALIMAIGAQNLFVLRQGLRGEHVGPIVVFFGLTDALLIFAGVNGAGALQAMAPRLASALTLGGIVFLVGYGLASFRRLARPVNIAVPEGGKITLVRAMSVGAALTFLNPHVYLDTVVLMGAAALARPVHLQTWFAMGAVAASFAWFASLGYGARLLRAFFTHPTSWRILDGIVGTIMLTLAGSLAFSVLHRPM